MNEFIQTVLYTDTDGRARFKTLTLALDEGTPQSRLSRLMSSGGNWSPKKSSLPIVSPRHNPSSHKSMPLDWQSNTNARISKNAANHYATSCSLN